MQKAPENKISEKILPFLHDILSNYDSYAWNKESIAKYKAEEEERIEKNEAAIKDITSKSVELSFSRTKPVQK